MELTHSIKPVTPGQEKQKKEAAVFEGFGKKCLGNPWHWTMPDQQDMSPTQQSFSSQPPDSSSMLRRRRSMDPPLALPPSDELEPGRDDAYGGLEVVEVKEEEGKVLEDEKKDERKEVSTPNRSTTGPLGSATGPTEGELFKSGGSKGSLRDLGPKGKPMMLAPLAPPQPQTMQPLFTQEQLRESKAAARKAPQIYGLVQSTSSSNEELHLQVKRPAFLKEEEEGFEEMKREDFERWKRGEGHEDEEEEESEELRKSEGGDRRRRDRHQQDEEEITWRWHMSQEVQKLTDLCHHQQKENDRLHSKSSMKGGWRTR